MLIFTESSVYEVLPDKHLIARQQSDCPPTERTGTREWRPYKEVQAKVGLPAVILWDITKDGVWKMTSTSTVLAIEGEDSHDA